MSWGCFPCPTIGTLPHEHIPLSEFMKSRGRVPAVHCPLACWLCHRAGCSSQFCPLPGIIWCQILDGHLEEAEHQLEFLKEVQQSLGKSKVRALWGPRLPWDPAPATPPPSPQPQLPLGLLLLLGLLARPSERCLQDPGLLPTGAGFPPSPPGVQEA